MLVNVVYFFFFFFKQKTAYEMRISDWSSDVCSSDLRDAGRHRSEQRALLALGPSDSDPRRAFEKPARAVVDDPEPARHHALRRLGAAARGRRYRLRCRPAPAPPHQPPAPAHDLRRSGAGHRPRRRAPGFPPPAADE